MTTDVDLCDVDLYDVDLSDGELAGIKQADGAKTHNGLGTRRG